MGSGLKPRHCDYYYHLVVDLSFFICKMGLTTAHHRTMPRTKGGDKGRVFRWPCRRCWYPPRLVPFLGLVIRAHIWAT